MLRSEIPFAIDTWPRRALAASVGEPFLGFLAISALGLTLFPILFAVKPEVDVAIEAAQWTIIAWFAIELVLAFAFAADKARFAANPWRWLDLATILVPLASLLPSASSVLRSSPILRLARLGRLVSYGLRASGVTTRRRTLSTDAAKRHGPAQVSLVSEDRADFETATLERLLDWLRSPDERWFHVAAPTVHELEQIGAAAGLPRGFLEQHLLGMNYPHWAPVGTRSGVFVWLPEPDSEGRMDRLALLLIPMGDGLLSLSRRKPREAIEAAEATSADDARPLAARMIARVLARVVRDYRLLAGRCEERLRDLEDMPVRESQPAFFERTFRLKKELSSAQVDLWRLKGIADDLVQGRNVLAPVLASAEAYRRFASDVDYLYETMVNIREGVLSVIDLHLNVVSFEMNRVMRVLAVVSVVGLIPAIVGGLLGMNLIDTPWPLTLAQVAFLVLFGMVLGVYFFFVKGWLR